MITSNHDVQIVKGNTILGKDFQIVTLKYNGIQAEAEPTVVETEKPFWFMFKAKMNEAATMTKGQMLIGLLLAGAVGMLILSFLLKIGWIY